MQKNLFKGLLIAATMALSGFVGCGDIEESGDVGDEFGVLAGEVDEHGKGLLDSDWQEPAGKADALSGRKGLSTRVDNDSLAVWSIDNQWEDTETEAARKAGMAWGEGSGLTWEQKYRAWIGAMEKTSGESYGETFTLLTPFGKTLPAPALECAEVAMFLRITFASWYNLPFYMEARDRKGNRLYFGHFGIRTAAGRYGSMPRFNRSYKDFSDQSEAFINGEVEWPVDEKLAARKIAGSFDDAQPMI
jgi:hypothetical protein